MKTLIKSELRELIKTKSLREIGKIYGVSYERIRQICVSWGIPRRGWQKIELVDDEGNTIKKGKISPELRAKMGIKIDGKIHRLKDL